ncbi:MAG: transcriptional repressor [Deltaproteobacteria bacterium]|nr:transcriptional repressor [Deltaproteobacteria bacterium]
MDQERDYERLLAGTGLKATPNRLLVLKIVSQASSPRSVRQIHAALSQSRTADRVTIYRILDLLKDRGLVERLSFGGRSFRYGPAEGAGRPAHPHFFCTECHQMECLAPESLRLDLSRVRRTTPARIDKVEVRLDGVCKNCLRRQPSS